MCSIKQLIDSLVPKLKRIYTHLHQNPEVSWREIETTKYITHLLEDEERCRVSTFPDIPGLIVDIGSGKQPIIALRADMDALWQEVNGTFQANHSCGHDAHMTIALGTIFTLLKKGENFNGTFRFLFQPAEEKGTGALALVERGVVDEVDYLYGMHLRPKEELATGMFSPAIHHGAAAFIEGTIRGEDAHAARPHLNANAIEIGSAFVHHLSKLYVNPMTPYSAKMTTFHAGGKSANIIPGNATFSLDVRAQTNETMEKLTTRIERLTRNLANLYDVQITLEKKASVAAAVRSEEAIEHVTKAIRSTVGSARLAPIIETTGGDDFHFYTLNRRHIKATMLGIGCNLTPGLHHPKMTFSFSAIPEAVHVLAEAMLLSTN